MREVRSPKRYQEYFILRSLLAPFLDEEKDRPYASRASYRSIDADGDGGGSGDDGGSDDGDSTMGSWKRAEGRQRVEYAVSGRSVEKRRRTPELFNFLRKVDLAPGMAADS
ncbi:hypothetical protein HZH68_002178 [Vespula germanica]|uniref:Uncharacterized protein n=1 Tax=Vespula germanica TaxID=30212 RepID=A0A834NM22_VESGE|nr:hypothetical protein HZH68_002178 [Vespula germanica]